MQEHFSLNAWRAAIITDCRGLGWFGHMYVCVCVGGDEYLQITIFTNSSNNHRLYNKIIKEVDAAVFWQPDPKSKICVLSFHWHAKHIKVECDFFSFLSLSLLDSDNNPTSFPQVIQPLSLR